MNFAFFYYLYNNQQIAQFVGYCTKNSV